MRTGLPNMGRRTSSNKYNLLAENNVSDSDQKLCIEKDIDYIFMRAARSKESDGARRP